MNVFGVGLPEIAVIGALALLGFGPKRLPEIGRSLGKTLKGFQAASSEFEREIQKAIEEPTPLDKLTTSDSSEERTSSGESNLSNEAPKPPSN